MDDNSATTESIAIVGMSGRFPGAVDLRQFWRNLADGIESLTPLSDEELLEAGVPANLIANPNYVKKATVLEGAELFDAEFFGYNPREAEIIDPQQRVFLECAWEALEDAGYSSDAANNAGVYAGASINTYLLANVLPNRALLEAVGGYQVMLASDKDFLATRVSYKLNLGGPSMAIQTACSTSLVAVQVACQGLLGGQCDLALAGGVSVAYPAKGGYLYTEGMILSPDGHCRPFDADGRGIRPGAGAGVVVLKRLSDALRDGDSIRAVIKGAAVNNDGSAKIGYTAPSVEGQARAIGMAHAMAGVDPESIGYIEAHGTGTVLGDPIELAALQQVFRKGTDKKQFCAIGSLKSNLGHLDAAAGVAGLIKTVLALENGAIPATLHYCRPNPQFNFEESPFFVNRELRPWTSDKGPRRAGVSSFGIGGTNAHVVLEEAPAPGPTRPTHQAQLLVLSAKSPAALDAAAARLGKHLSEHPEVELANVCYTLQTGRKRFAYRRWAVCSTRQEAVAALSNPASRGVFAAVEESLSRPVAFLFSGQGSQHTGMAAELYRQEPVFRETLDRCAELLLPHLGCDLRELLYSAAGSADGAPGTRLNDTNIAQPALFAIEYSLARLWMSWGIVPDAAIGHSIGEYVAACLAGVFSLEDGLALVAARGRLMQQLPRGSMLSVPLPAAELEPLIYGDLAIAAVNSPSLCTASGPDAEIEALERELQARGLTCRRIHTSHAFHSSMMDPVLDRFRDAVGKVRLSEPSLPFISNLTGTWIRPGEATDPAYWARHLRHTVRFADGVRELLAGSGRILLEVGPGQVLTTFAREIGRQMGATGVFASLPHPQDPQPADAFALHTLGRLWAAGAPVDWQGFHQGAQLHRVPLPTYPFERKRFYVEPKPAANGATSGQSGPPEKRPDIADWFYVPSWKRAVAPCDLSAASRPASAEQAPWLLFMDEMGLGADLVEALAPAGERITTVVPGQTFERLGENQYALSPGNRDHYDLLLRALRDSGAVPRTVLHLWNVTPGGAGRDASFYSLICLAQAWADALSKEPLRLLVISNGLHAVCSPGEPVYPEKALLLGPCKVIPQEIPAIACRSVDVRYPAGRGPALVASLLSECGATAREGIVAYREGQRWIATFEPVRLDAPVQTARLRPKGVYLITGGLGGIGLTFARFLAESVQARLILTARSPLPPPAECDAWLAAHEASDPTSEKIRLIRELEVLGAEVLVCAAEASDPDAMRRVVEEARRRFGPIAGAIHAAGIAGAGMVQLKTRDAAERVFAPKVEGTLILESLVEQDRPDFIVLCSSVNAIYGGFGAVDYSAANAFQDCFALSRAGRKGPAVISVDWDTWQEVGMAVKTRVPGDLHAARLQGLESGIKPAEGVQALQRILATRLPQVAVVTRDLPTMLREIARAAAERVAGEDQSRPAVVEAARHARPDLAGAYAAPENETQRGIAAIWTELLGIDPLGIDDNFFELGGHSLLATGILSRIQSCFGVSVPMRAMFEAPTVRALAERIDTVLWATASPAPRVEDAEMEEIEL